MTEIVQKRLELMTEELEEMRRTKLFTVEETRIIFKKRKEFEHKIHAISKEIKSFEDYITYERCLLKDIRLRRDKHKIGDKKNSIEHKIIRRIKILYEMALQLFTNDISLFLAFLKFCKKVNYVNAATETVHSLIKLHSDKPEVWKVAANWYAYDRKDVNGAMGMLLKALQIHKDSEILYTEMITIELYNMVHNKANKDKCVKRVKEVVETIFQNIKDPKFYIELLHLLEEHHCTIGIQDFIIEKMIGEYFDNENVWHAIAQRERRGIYFSSEVSSHNQAEAITKNRTPKAKLEACFAKYKEGLLKVSSNTKSKLWDLYLDFLIELQQDTFGGATVLKSSTLKSALQEACNDECLMEKHYIAWLELAPEEDGLQIAEKGTEAYPHSVELWKLRLQFQIIQGELTKVDQVFKLGVIELKEKALPLWKAIIRYHGITSDDNYVNLIYKDGVKQPKEVSNPLKLQYLEWLTFIKGIEASRQEYRRFAVQPPYYKELHTMMSKLESLQIKFDFKSWEEVHELACRQFGREDVDVWIDYIYFYTHYYKEHDNPAERINSLYNRAEQNLPKSLIFDFLTKYSKITED